MLTEETYKLVEEYRKSEDIQEIDTFIMTLKKKGHQLLAWQKLPDGERIVRRVMVEEYNQYEKEMKLAPIVSSEEKVSDFYRKYPLYLHTSYGRGIMEVQVIHVSSESNHIYTYPPDTIYIWEQKRIPRIRINQEASKVTFQKQEKNYECSILDISNKGMAIRIPQVPAINFSFIDDEIAISKLFEKRLDKSIPGRVVYFKQIDDENRSKGFRVGIEFKSEIDITDAVPQMLS